MEPRIQYAKTSDGVSIAYAAAGKGRTVIFAPTPPLSHVQRQPAVYPRLMEGLAERFHTVWYDSRGSGLSDRDVIDFSMSAMVRDLEAVAESAEEGQFALFAAFDGVPIAITYAAARPERVSHLIVADGWIRFSDYHLNPAFEAEAALRQQDWLVYTETLARVLIGFDDPVIAAAFGEHIRACVEPDALRAAYSSLGNEVYDVADLLDQLTTPTLVLHNSGNRFLPVRVGQRLAAGIRNARFLVIDDVTYQEVPRLVADFIGEAGVERYAEHSPGALRTILFTDIEGSTAMTQRLGDAKAREVLREHERITREALKAHGGSEVKTMGDGFMASFGSAVKALECAITIQTAFDERNTGVGAGFEPAPTEPIRVRIGLNAGEPIAEDDPDGRGDLFGTAVIRAARIAALAQGGEILAANVVRELAEGKGFLFGDRGEVALRGFDDPVRLFEVRWREGGT
jgi:class 3 adenylate cyclase